MKKVNKNEKKKLLIRGIILLVIGIAGLIFGIYSINHKNSSNNKNKVTDAIKFKNEYEELNGKSTDAGKKYLDVSIDEKNPMKYISFDDLMDLLEDGTGIVYFGFPECPWCRNAITTLIEAAKDEDINEIYYFNAHDMRDEKKLDENGNIITTKEGTEEYNKIVEKLYDSLDVYSGLNDDTIKRLYFPNVFFISNGKVVGNHMSTVDSQEDPYIELNDEQREELKNIYTENIKKVFNYECNDGC